MNGASPSPARVFRPIDLGSVPLAERITHPVAVGVRHEGESDMQVVRFDNKGAAELYATLMDSDTTTICRWVALTEPEWLLNPVTPGWRQVSYFYL